MWSTQWWGWGWQPKGYGINYQWILYWNTSTTPKTAQFFCLFFNWNPYILLFDMHLDFSYLHLEQCWSARFIFVTFGFKTFITTTCIIQEKEFINSRKDLFYTCLYWSVRKNLWLEIVNSTSLYVLLTGC